MEAPGEARATAPYNTVAIAARTSTRVPGFLDSIMARGRTGAEAPACVMASMVKTSWTEDPSFLIYHRGGAFHAPRSADRGPISGEKRLLARSTSAIDSILR